MKERNVKQSEFFESKLLRRCWNCGDLYHHTTEHYCIKCRGLRLKKLTLPILEYDKLRSKGYEKIRDV